MEAAAPTGVAPVFHLSLGDGGGGSSPASWPTGSCPTPAARERLVAAICNTVALRGYRGVDVDFEFLYGEDAAPYARFLGQLRRALATQGVPLTVALAPKTADGQLGRLYEGLDFGLIAREVDCALLMTYDWGWPGGPPMAVSPLPQVRQAAEYALTHFSPPTADAGHPQLRLRLAPALPGGEPGGVGEQRPGGAPGLGPARDHPLRPDGPGPLVPLCGRGGAGAPGLVRGPPEHPGQGGAGPGAGGSGG